MKHTSEQVQVNFYKYPDRGISGSSPPGTFGIAEVVKFWMSSSKHIQASLKSSAQNVEHRDAAAYSQPAPSGPTQTTTADYYLLRGVGILMTPSVLHQDNFPLWMCCVATQRSVSLTFWRARAHTHTQEARILQWKWRLWVWLSPTYDPMKQTRYLLVSTLQKRLVLLRGLLFSPGIICYIYVVQPQWSVVLNELTSFFYTFPAAFSSPFNNGRLGSNWHLLISNK